MSTHNFIFWGAFVLFIMIIILIFIPFLTYREKHVDMNISCPLNTYSHQKGDGYVIIDNILNDRCRHAIVSRYLYICRKKKKLNNDIELSLYTDPMFLNEVSKIVGRKLYPVNKYDKQRCWLRYYYGGMKSQYYENLHNDIKRYNDNIKQYRLIISLYDKSDSKFTIKDFGQFDIKENMAVMIEAENCEHKVEITKGERLVLIMDFIDAQCEGIKGHYSCRGPKGYMNWVKDTCWRYGSSVYYQLKNM